MGSYLSSKVAPIKQLNNNKIQPSVLYINNNNNYNNNNIGDSMIYERSVENSKSNLLKRRSGKIIESIEYESQKTDN